MDPIGSNGTPFVANVRKDDSPQTQHFDYMLMHRFCICIFSSGVGVGGMWPKAFKYGVGMIYGTSYMATYSKACSLEFVSLQTAVL